MIRRCFRCVPAEPPQASSDLSGRLKKKRIAYIGMGLTEDNAFQPPDA
jgi:hypothetical protein